MSLHRLLRSSAHASPSRALKRMSSAPRCIARCTAAWHAGARSSSLQHLDVDLKPDFRGVPNHLDLWSVLAA
jgi:hypothetical protein